jgi:Ca-activated chloride channel family protein
LSLAQPAWLILLVLLPLLGTGALVIARLRKKQWSAFVAPRLRGALLRRGSPLPRWFGFLFLLAACGAIIGSLARPRADAGTRTEKTLGRNVLIALDLSRSMRVADVKPDRLSQAKLIIFELLEAMPNERIGLIGFAGTAYPFAPLTIDHGAVREVVEQIDETWTTQGGSNLSEALELAIETLKETGQKNNALVILSDGEHHDDNLDTMISEAERAGIYILAIGVGTEDGDYVPNSDFPGNRMLDRNANPVLSRLQPDVMRKLAAETKGRYAVAGSGVDIPAIVKSAIQDLDAFELEGRERKVSIEFYQWLLLPAIVFLLGSIVAATRWRGVNPPAVATVACMLAAAPQPSRADAVADARAALEAKDWSRARESYKNLAEGTALQDRRARFRLGEGTAAYRGGDFRQARTAFSKAIAEGSPEVLENAHLGMGNTLFQLGWNSIAKESYPNNPDDLPDLGKFDALIKEQLAKLKEGGEDDSGGYLRFETLTRNWTDAVRHYDSSLAAGTSNNTAAGRNRATTITYLKRLQELLRDEEEETQQSLPQPQPGEGEPQKQEDGESDGKQEEGDEGEGQDQPEGDSGEGGEESDRDGSGDDKEDPEKGNSGDKDDKEKEDPDDGKGEPDETPEDRARRILKENADLEKGPLTPGRRELRDPEKDW